MELDKEYLDNESSKQLEEEEKQLEELLIHQIEKGYWEMKYSDKEDELKDQLLKQNRISFIARLFNSKEEWKHKLFELKDFKVIKFPRVIQSAMYFMGVDRKEICEHMSNKLWWKIAKHQLNDQFLQSMEEYWCMGPKPKFYVGYHTINFIEKNLEGISLEEVE
mmetsp:Transcript_20507/g.19478  ORF Transcript_20507/g.19478 Transcript_20507/m.19478 type:complete len:164 (+) Transcript_20507:204-695(+)